MAFSFPAPLLLHTPWRNEDDISLLESSVTFHDSLVTTAAIATHEFPFLLLID